MIRAFASLVLGAALLVACGESTRTKDPELKWDFGAGEALRYRATADTEATTPMGVVKQSQTLELVLDTSAPGDDGKATVDVTFDRLKLHIENPVMGGAAEYDSTSPDAAEQARNPAIQAMTGIVGKRISLTVDRLGEHHATTGIDEIVAGMDPEGSIPASMRAQVADQLTAPATDIFLGLPAEEPAVGATWEAALHRQGGMGAAFTIDAVMTLEEVEDVAGARIARISCAVKEGGITMKPPEPDPDNPLSSMMSQLTLNGGDFKGEFRFDMSRGRLSSSRMEYTLTLGIMGMEIATKTVETTELVTDAGAAPVAKPVEEPKPEEPEPEEPEAEEDG